MKIGYRNLQAIADSGDSSGLEERLHVDNRYFIAGFPNNAASTSLGGATQTDDYNIKPTNLEPILAAAARAGLNPPAQRTTAFSWPDLRKNPEHHH